jgi:hydroxyacylglutathione hydrolase
MRIDVTWSGIWQTTSTVLSLDGGCLVVDPAYFPRELDDLAALARSRGETLAVAFTHGHWDHIAGWQSFPGAEVLGAPRLAQAVAAADESALADARDFDGRWYVTRPEPLRWPPAVRAVGEGPLTVGPLELRALSLPGHSPDGLGLIAGDVLLPGDYLSPCEIPFVDDAAAYRDTLVRLLGLLGADVGTVIPGHGPRLSAAQARAIAEADVVYVEALLAAPDEAAALAIPWPRAALVPGMGTHHEKNCRLVISRRGV